MAGGTSMPKFWHTNTIHGTRGILVVDLQLAEKVGQPAVESELLFNISTCFIMDSCQLPSYHARRKSLSAKPWSTKSC